ncbi:PHP domain-containing protein, partial [Weissella soli]
MVPLNTKSAFTLLQSPLMPNQLVKQAAEYHYEAVGLADQDVLYGLADFYTAAVQTQIKPILGLTVQVAGLETSIADSFAVTLFVENQTGYHHLIEISSLVKTNRQVLTWQDL